MGFAGSSDKFSNAPKALLEKFRCDQRLPSDIEDSKCKGCKLLILVGIYLCDQDHFSR